VICFYVSPPVSEGPASIKITGAQGPTRCIGGTQGGAIPRQPQTERIRFRLELFSGILPRVSGPPSPVWYAQRDLAVLDQRWRGALRSAGTGVTVSDAAALSEWSGRAGGTMYFESRDGSSGGEITFDRGAAPHPGELCQMLGLSEVWLIALDLSWAVLAGHEDWDRVQLFELGCAVT
jgi:hypothetical protein